MVAFFAELDVLDKANLDCALILIALAGDAIEAEGELGLGGVGEDWSDVFVIVVIDVLSLLLFPQALFEDDDMLL